MLRHHGLQALARHVRVDRRRGNVRVPQQHLHSAQVGAVVEQVRGERMAQGVRRQWRGDAGLARVALHQLPEHHARHGRTGARATRGDEQILARQAAQDGGTALGEVTLQPVARHLAEGHQALFVALAGDAQHLLHQPQVPGLERDQFAHAQTARVHQLQHGAVAQAQRRVFVGRVQQRLHLRLAQRLGHTQRLARRGQPQRRVGGDEALAQRPAEVAAKHREAPVGRGGARLRVAFGEVPVDVGLERLGQGLAVGTQPGVEQGQVATVGIERVFRQPLFEPEAVDEGRQRGVLVGLLRLGHQSSLSFCLATTSL